MEKTSNINVLPLLICLFPKFENLTKNKTYGLYFKNEWRRSCRICSPEVVDTYFKLDIGNTEIRESELGKFVESTADVLLFREYLKAFVLDGRIRRALELLEDYTSENPESGALFIREENIEKVIIVLLDMGDAFPEVDNGGHFYVTTSLRIARIIHQLTSRINDQKERGALIIRCVDEAKNSLSSSVYIIRLYDQEHGKFSLKKDPEPEETRTVSPGDLLKLEKIGLKRIEKAAKSGTLYLNNSFSTILFAWRDWGSSDTVKKYIYKNLKSDEFFMKLIKGFINIVTIYGIDESAVKNENRFDLESFKTIVSSIDVIRGRALELREYKQLNAEQQGNLEVFIKATEALQK